MSLAAFNKNPSVHFSAYSVAGSEKVVKGNVKNHVKKGGWSQQRYERRRDKQLLLYAREIVDALADLEKKEKFRRVILAGGKEILRIIQENLPQTLQNKVAKKALDLGKKNIVNKDIMDLFKEQERQSELDLWEKIRTEYLRGGLGIVGIHEVLTAAKESRISEMIVHREFHPKGKQCRDCKNLDIGTKTTCSACNSKSTFTVDLVNEMIELLKLSGADVDFADPMETLLEAGEIAALLRY